MHSTRTSPRTIGPPRGARLRARLLALGLVLGCASGPARAAFDPELQWKTLESRHFRVTYYTGLDELARHVADVGEAAYATLTPPLGWQTDDKTEVLLVDTTDGANGSATALPLNIVRLNVTAPDDLSPLGDVDDWHLALVTHELTHILHTDNITGLPVLVNRLLGKTLAPNQVQPRWILEGLAVYFESTRTSGGRLRSSMWNMFMRTDVLENNVASLAQFSNNVRRWPQGNIWYLYGSFFIQWVAETYGEEALRRMSEEYGRQPIPWGLSRTMRRVTGHTWDELYEGWLKSLSRRVAEEAQRVRARGVREGTRLTFHGQIARTPRWIPRGALGGREGKLVYFRDDADDRPGLYSVSLPRDGRGALLPGSRPPSTELLVRTAGESSATFGPDGRLFYSTPAFYSNLFVYNDLYTLAPGETSPSALDGKPRRMTHGFRAIDPAVSPDGKTLAFVTNHHGIRSLQIADLEADGISRVRSLAHSAPFEQAFTPRFSPDGRSIVYSRWVRGGYRDLRLMDVATGAARDLTHDRAVDGGPSFSPDGTRVFYHSDRSGISNVYSVELSSGEVRQITNVLTGAYQPSVSPDGKTLAYVGYTKDGFDVFAMPLDPARSLEPEPYVDRRPSMPHVPSHAQYTVHPYSPLPTLRPRKYSISTSPGNFGQQVTASVSASDLTGRHGITGTLTQELERPELQGSLVYGFGGMRFDTSAAVSRSVTPRPYQIGGARIPAVQEAVGFTTALSYASTNLYASESYGLSYSLRNIGIKLPTSETPLDPYETPQRIRGGIAGTLGLAYTYTNAERYLWSLGAERGFTVSLAFNLNTPVLGSEFEGFSTTADFTQYFLMPWLRHHSLAVHLGAGTSGGSFPGRSAFFVGGFVDLPLVDTLRDTLIQGGVVLRGYPAGFQGGTHFTLGNLEYRFPIANFDRGSSTLPIFLNRLSGTAFLDYGSAFDTFSTAKFKTGTGAELWLEMTLGYYLGLTFRFGYARGLASEGIDKLYFVAAIPF